MPAPKWNYADFVHCLTRDPASWKNISLLLLRGGKEMDAPLESIRSKTDAVILEEKTGEWLVLGLERLPEELVQKAPFHLWIENLAAQWQDACNMLEMARPEQETSLDTTSQRTPNILVVEDDPMTSQLATHHLKPFGRVLTTSNSRQAAANYTVRRPDMVFLDIHYKDDLYDGFDVLANLLSADKDAFIVMVSADRNPQTIFKALMNGARGFIAKPFRSSDFADYLAKLA